MYTRKKPGILIIAFVGILVLGAVPTSAQLSRSVPVPILETQPPETPKNSAQNPTVVVSPLGDQIGDNFVIRNDIGLVEEHPAIAYSSLQQEYLVVWYNDRSGNDDIRGQRVSRNGELIGGAFYISAGPGADRRYPAVSYNSKHDQYLIVWEHNDGLWNSIRARRVSGTGAVLDTTDIVLTSGSNIITPAKPAVEYAYTSDKYLVVWQETFHPIPIQSDILGQVVSSSGTLEGSPFVISKDPGNIPRKNPVLAYNRKRNEFLVVWQKYYSSSIDFVIGRRVTGGGLPLNPAEIVIHAVTVSSTNPSVAALPDATASGQYLVVFELLYPPSNYNIYSRFVSGEGVVGAGQYIASSSEDETHPAIASNEVSKRYLVAWTRPTSPPIVYDYIAGRSISTTGALIGAEKYIGGFPLADQAVISSGPFGDFMIAFKDQQPPSIDSGIYGQLWGDRVYLPLTLRNH
ncbi:MAG: hypothetical protein ACK2UM_03990 [Anaerolineales bacterium]